MAQSDQQKQSTIVVVACALGAVALAFLLQNVLHLGTGATVGVAVLLVIVVTVVGVALAVTIRRRKIREDASKSVDPILKRYERTRNAAQLIREYDEWVMGDHDPQLQLEFLQATAKQLATDGFAKQARRQVQKAGELDFSKIAPKQYEKFRAEVEEIIAKGGLGSGSAGNRAQRRAQKSKHNH